MSLRQRLENDVKAAMRARDELARDALRMVLSDVKKLEIDTGRETQDADVLDVLGKACRTRAESLEQFQRAGRTDLADKERREIELLQRYLPRQLSEPETRQIVQDAIAALGIQSRKDLGRLMKEVLAKHKGQVDGGVVQRMAAELLQP